MTMKQTLSIARKELSAYFGSPMALIFVGAFLAVTLFTFFWVDTFFARGIADVRPMFRAMPVLMIFLVAALTMRQWSDEQRSGTLEMLLTLPVSKIQLVLGKFFAVMVLVVLALALTLFLPITVSLLGSLDWGPVIGGYLAAILMAAAYAAIGLFVSSRTDNQLVALILTVIVAGTLYLVGSSGVTDFAPGAAGAILRALGAGSRFESIERGVIDLRDLLYYVSITGIFLVLNIVSVDRKRWSSGEITAPYRRGVVLTSALLVVNLLLMNVWLYPLNGLRLDLTAQREYSLSETTRELLTSLGEPLTIRAFVSEKTHPLLAPLQPQLEDLLREYEIAGRGKVVAEVVDPTTDPDVEVEANETYGIQPSAFQVAGRYESSVINAYFDVLVRYGDQTEVLNFQDLIEVQPTGDGGADVRFRNLEYDLTRTIKRTTSGFQSVDNLLASLDGKMKLTLYATAGTLPEVLAGAPEVFQKVGQELAGKSNGALTFEMVDPDAPGAAVTRSQLLERYRLRPIAVSLFSDESYYLDLLLESEPDEQGNAEVQLVSPAGDLSEASVRSAIEAALKRSSKGFLKTVGIWSPPQTPTADMFGQQQAPFRTWQMIRQQLSQDYTVQEVDLSTGQAPGDIDVLLVISPQGLDDKAKYAVDQFLMRGGSVIVAAGNYSVGYDQYMGGLMLNPVEGGLNDLLAHYGITVENSLVMDAQNEPFPMPVQRNVGGITVQEIQALNYPFFADIRTDGMDSTHPIVSQLNAVTLNWASPVTVDETKNQDRQTSVLLRSSDRSWLRTSLDINPNLEQYPQTGFAVEGEQSSHALAVAVSGSFESYFRGKPSPLLQAGQEAAEGQPTPTPVAQTGSTIESSPDSARLVVIGSGEFLTDVIFQISSSMSGDRYLNSLQLAQNAVDWAVEDLDLLSIRARGTSSRMLAPLSDGQQRFVEFLNYGLALAGLGAIGILWGVRRRNEKPLPLVGEKR
jgi:ABC-2 type transport system permease protein